MKLKTGVTNSSTSSTTPLLSIDESCVTAAALEIYRRAGKRGRSRHGAEQGAGDVRRPHADQLLVGLDLLAAFGRQPLVIEAASSMPRNEMAMAVPASSGRRWSLRGPKWKPGEGRNDRSEGALVLDHAERGLGT